MWRNWEQLKLESVILKLYVSALPPFSFTLWAETLFFVISRAPVRHVIVAVTALMTSMRITGETVFLWTTAPVCTVAKYSAQVSAFEPAAKPGNIYTSASFFYLFIQSHAGGARGELTERLFTLSYSTCGQGQWHCKDEPCPGKCQVYGNGHYQTFDSKWYRFDGHCQYTLVQVRQNMEARTKSTAYFSL